MLKKCQLGFRCSPYPVAHDFTGIDMLGNQHLTHYSYQHRNSYHYLNSFDMCVTLSKDILFNLYTGIFNFCFASKCSTLLANYWQTQGNCHHHTSVYTVHVLSFKTPLLQDYPPIYVHLEGQEPSQAILKTWQMFMENSTVHRYPMHGEKLPEHH